MKIRANPTAIGLFMIGAVVLTVGGVTVLASGAWLEERSTFISYFSESVNGLERGAAVKFQGVPVGTVTELLIQIDQGDKTFQVPIQYDVDLTRLTTEIGTFVQLNEAEVLRQQIADGLRAQLQMESLVTGQLYVELTYRPDAPPPPLEPRPTPYPEIPTTPSLLAAFGTEAGSVVADVLEILFRMNQMLDEVDMQGINTAVVASAQAVERLVGSEELRQSLAAGPELAAGLGRAMTEMEGAAERLGASIDPLRSQMEGTMAEVELTLQAARQALEGTQSAMTTDSGLGYRMDQALISFRDAAEALRVLAITLERNPDMLIRGADPRGPVR
ncbi:MAG: MlaD family protein [Gemmatimonadota bacterium]|jgi:paraquat-inducible protein B